MKKKIIVSLLTILLLAGVSGVIYYYYFVQDSDSTLTASEKQWIQDNKNNVIDISLPNNVAVFSYAGEGVFFDFLKDVEEKTNMTFNQLSYNVNEKPNSEYAFSQKVKLEDKDVLVYQDNYVLVTKEDIKYTNLSDIPVMTVGVLEQDLQRANEYLKANGGISFQTYPNMNALLSSLDTGKVSGIILLKTFNIDQILSKKDYHISYQLTEMTTSWVLQLGNNKKLNTILKKYYAKWNKEKYEEVFNAHFSNNYFTYREVLENEKVKFRSKRYVYGFITNPPYDAIKGGSLIGINNELMKSFSHMADVEISFQEYKNLSSLTTAFNENKIDFFFNTSSNTNYALDTFHTTDVFKEKIAIISSLDNNITINSISSLVGKTVITIENSYIASSLSNYDISLKTYQNVEELLSHISSNVIIVLDKKTYDIYSKTLLKNYKVDHEYELENSYKYVSRDISDNKVFNEFLSFFVSFENQNYYANKITYKDFKEKEVGNVAIYTSIVLLFIGLVGIIVLLSRKRLMKVKKRGKKEEKLKYIDQLTSLKNRNFLNDSIISWDQSEVYPQTIIIVDLNNIAYINDNYGHEEGDKVIIESANILIKTQLENSEIIRTDGNEFLIYLVAYDEKQIVTYIRKLNKELKEISHGFGAALGYSMINDGIKTIDDAINEATLDMKTNKEETTN